MERSSGVRALVAAIIAGVALSATPAFAQSKGINLSVGPVRVEFTTDQGGTRTVSAYVSGGVESSVAFRMYDAVPNPEGGWIRVRYGSTPGTLQGRVDIAPADFDYVPNGREQQFDAALTVAPATVSEPRWGVLVVFVEPKGTPAAGEVAARAAVAIQVVQLPEGGVVPAADLGVELTRLKVTQIRQWTLVDRLLPDIPGVIGRGPVRIRALGRNTGSYFLDSQTTIEIARISPLSLLPFFSGSSADPRPVLTVNMRPRYVLPGQIFWDDMTSVLTGVRGQRAVDSLPFIGFVRITATATGKLGPIEAEPSTISKTVLVFPWSEFLFVFVVFLVQREWRHRRGRRVNTTDAPPPPTLRTRVREGIRRLLSLPRRAARRNAVPVAPPVADERPERDAGEGDTGAP